ncbi:hypothetical protein GIB67_037948 [Kingdonia uniflora]|uniref:Uncharacterized protein n=1 Tax=Kingdonia uniflora TaxID=39325 RepID=A0A7J7LHG6_9MAGN|nr:hypothetical protein GIB67_037948 [Kingdonia uniflora]
MLVTLASLCEHYEYFVRGHFLERAHVFLGECKAYTEGAQVEFLEDKSGTFKLKTEVSHILPRLVQAFTKNGAKECEQFLPAPGNP